MGVFTVKISRMRLKKFKSITAVLVKNETGSNEVNYKKSTFLAIPCALHLDFGKFVPFFEPVFYKINKMVKYQQFKH